VPGDPGLEAPPDAVFDSSGDSPWGDISGSELRRDAFRFYCRLLGICAASSGKPRRNSGFSNIAAFGLDFEKEYEFNCRTNEQNDVDLHSTGSTTRLNWSNFPSGTTNPATVAIAVVREICKMARAWQEWRRIQLLRHTGRSFQCCTHSVSSPSSTGNTRKCHRFPLPL